MSRRLLDVVLDALQRGEDLVIVELATECQFPRYTPLTAYMRGCRCERCRVTKAAAARRYRCAP